MAATQLVLRDIDMVLTPEIKAAIETVFPGRKNPFPLGQQELSFVLEGVPPSVSNAFQRVITQELPGYALHVDKSDFANKREGLRVDPFMTPEFLQNRIQSIPLRFGLEPADVDGITFQIKVQNNTDSVTKVYTGDMKILKHGKPLGGPLPLPFFNPSLVVAIIQPGYCLDIQGIEIVQDIGRLFSATSNAIRGRQVPLDIPEHPHELTHRGLDGIAQLSGYVPSTFTTFAMKHRVTVVIRAALKGSRRATRLPVDACNRILHSLRSIRGVIERGDERRAQTEAGMHNAADASGMQASDEDNNSWIVQKIDSHSVGGASSKVQGVLQLRNETYTIIELLRVEISSLVPNLAHVSGEPRLETDSIQFKIHHHCSPDDLSKYLLQTVTNLVDLFQSLEKQLAAL